MKIILNELNQLICKRIMSNNNNLDTVVVLLTIGYKFIIELINCPFRRITANR